MSPTRKSAQSYKVFDNPRQSSEKTNPDYAEHSFNRVVNQLLSLPFQEQKTMFNGFEPREAKAILYRLREWPTAQVVLFFLEEADRCLKADAPHGAACVSGKALDALLHFLNFDLKGTLGRKLSQLEDVRKKEPQKILSARSRKLVDRCLKQWKHITTRNESAHYIARNPYISLDAAGAFYEQVVSLYQMEKERQSQLADDLQRSRKQKRFRL